jgi:hypothetical protein
VRAAVLGRPIAHSLSPPLHRAAYEALGLDWTYDAVECGEDDLPALLDGLDASWAGLSLTMPLKQAVLPLLDEVSDLARDVAAANTVVLREGRRAGSNTDVHGIVAPCAKPGWVRRSTRSCWAGERRHARRSPPSPSWARGSRCSSCARSRGRPSPPPSDSACGPRSRRTTRRCSTGATCCQHPAAARGPPRPATSRVAAVLLDVVYDPGRPVARRVRGWCQRRRDAAPPGAAQVRLMTGRPAARGHAAGAGGR